jgi:uncharacterized protein (DUF2249 family)
MAQVTASRSIIDVRDVAPRDRHPLIFATFRALQAGERMELVNDHDPKPLYYQFQSDAPGSFEWEYLARGPETWRVATTRVGAGAPASGGSCCGGGCSGGA